MTDKKSEGKRAKLEDVRCKYDWPEIKYQFMKSDFESVRQFCLHYGIKYQAAYVRQSSRNEDWNKEKKEGTSGFVVQDEIIKEVAAAKIKAFNEFNESVKLANDLMLNRAIEILQDDSLCITKANSSSQKRVISSALRVAKELIVEANKNQRVCYDIDKFDIDESMPEPLVIENLDAGGIY